MTLAFTFINYIRELITKKLDENGVHFDENGVHFLNARKFFRRPTSSEVIASEQWLCSASIEHAMLVYIQSV